MKSKTKRFAAVAAILITLIFFIFPSKGGASAKADVAASPRSKTVAAYESQNVWDDLQGASIDGEKLDLNLYNFDEHKNVQIISFVEFCYSFYAENQGDYGLYVYVYNPRGCDFTKNTLLNKIALRVDAGLSIKPNLQFLNRSNKTGYEGLFYKFKVALTDEQRTEILDAVNSLARVYEVSGIELYSEGTNATEYKVANKYTYTGYAKGYGEVGAVNDTLNCHCEDNQITLSLDVHPTYYRPEGTNGKNNYTQDMLYSVYFSIPNKILNKFGGLSAVHAQWLNATTAPIFVTENEELYNGILPYIGKTLGEHKDIRSEMPYGFTSDIATYNTYGNTGDLIHQLNYIFFADKNMSDDSPFGSKFVLSSEDLTNWLTAYTGKYGGELVQGKYSRALFDKVDTEFTEVYKRADDKYTLTNEKLTQTFWEWLFGAQGTQVVGSETFKNINAIHEVVSVDFEGNEKTICKNLYITEADYEDFKEYYDSAVKADKTVFLFRYYQADYMCDESEGYKYDNSPWQPEMYSVIDRKEYVAKEVVNLDFDIIDVTCSQGAVETVITCVMSPIDIVHELTPPPNTRGDGNGTPWWVWLIVGIGVFLLLCFIPGFLPFVGKVLFWTIALPFRILWAVICAPFRIIKQRREKRRKALEKDRAREEKRMQKEQRKRKLTEQSEPEAQTSAKPKEDKKPKKKITEQLAAKLKRKPKPQAKAKPTKKPAAEPAPQIKEAAATSDEQSAPKKVKKPQAKQFKQKNKPAPKSGKKG